MAEDHRGRLPWPGGELARPAGAVEVPGSAALNVGGYAQLSTAAHFGSIAPGEWQRTGSRSDGARFTVESFARYFIHDPVHHLYDVTGTPHAARQ